MRQKKKFMFRSVAIGAIVVVLCAVIASQDAAGQQVPEKTIQSGPGEAADVGAPIVAQDEKEQLFSINIEDADIRDVFESLAYQAGQSMILGDDIDGRVSLYLKDVTWQTAFNAILQVAGCTTTESQKVLVVSKAREMPDIVPEKQIETEIFKLNFANAKDLEKTIAELLSSDGKIGVDERLNSIVISDEVKSLEQIGLVIKKLDVKAPQVMIEVLMVNVKLTDELKMGVNWTQLGRATKNIFTQTLAATAGKNPIGQVNFSIPSKHWKIEGLVDFIESHDNVRILANPKVMVLNNHTATFKSVEEIPYQVLTKTSGGGELETTSFKDAGVTLEVTPQITDDGYIIMHIMPEQSAETGGTSVDGIPIIETRNVETTLRVRDGQTIIIGGLRKVQSSVGEDKIPILGDLPFIGALFRKVDTDKVESEIGVFITPHIYTDGELTAEESKLLHSSDADESLYKMSDLLRFFEDDETNN